MHQGLQRATGFTDLRLVFQPAANNVSYVATGQSEFRFEEQKAGRWSGTPVDHMVDHPPHLGRKPLFGLVKVCPFRIFLI